MPSKRIIFAVLAPIAFAALAAAAFVSKSVAIRTSLEDLVGDAVKAVPEAVRAKSSAMVPVLVSSPDAAAAAESALALATRLPTNDCEAVRCRVDADGLGDVLDFVAAHGAGLVSPSACADLATPEGRAMIARRHVKRLFTDPSPPLFPVAVDPFGLSEDYVKSLASSAQAGWTPRRGLLTAETNGVTTVMLVMELKREVASDADRLMDFKARLDEAFAASAREGVSFAACGVPLHTAVTAAKCKREIGALSVASVLFIILLSLFAFGSWRWLPLLALSIATAALAGFAALAVSFDSIHLMTIVLGTTLLGLVVDYSFHWLLRRRGCNRQVVKSLVVSWATTEVSLLPLLMSSLPVLRQSAVFLGTGLAAALAMVLFGYPREARDETDDDGPSAIWLASRNRLVKTVAALVAAAAGAGLCFVRFATTPESLYRSPADIAAAERFLAERSGAADGERGTLVIGGGSLEELIAKEESLAIPEGTPHLSALIPSLAVRRAVAQDIARLYEEQGESHAAVLGIAAPVAPQPPEAIGFGELPAVVAHAFVCGDSLVVPSVELGSIRVGVGSDGVGEGSDRAGEGQSGVEFFQPRRRLAEVLTGWTHETLRRLGFSLCLMLVILLAIYRRHALSVLAPSLLALAVVGSALGWMGRSVNLFHLLASFLLVGMGIDYAVFLRDGGFAALKPAVCSLLTSMVGFGLLAFASFPVVGAFGLTLGVGLPVAFLAAFATAVERRPEHGEKTEHGASPLGMETLWLVYRVFGLGALHLLASLVGATVWLFSGGVRRASPRMAKTVAFTRSLSDKLVVMAEGGRLPEVVLDGSRDAEAFVADVEARRGVFVLSSHVGTIEVLAALGECDVVFHAWMEFDRTGVFNRFYLRHAKRRKVVIHPISEFGAGTVFAAGDALDRGDSLVMAADRTFGRVRRVTARGREFELAEGAFRLARALEHPVYFVACVEERPGRYRAIVRRLKDDVNGMAAGYADALAEVSGEYPDQWFKWGS